MSDLARSTPHQQDTSAPGLLRFLDAAEAFEMHSLMIVRHGQVIAEGWWQPYTSDGLQLLYSLSKSFTSTAIGMAQAEGLLSVDDLVVDLLPEDCPDVPDEHLRGLRVRDALSMATGHRVDLLELMRTPDPVRAVLGTAAEEPPGTWFTYNQGATLLLSAIITRLTGLRLLDYLRPRLLEPMGITEANWHGVGHLDQGFSGLHLTTESVAKLGVLYLQYGIWGPDRLVPQSYVVEATQKQVDNPREPEIDWRQGYGFQFWMARHGYRGDGACGQFCIVLPEQDAVVVTTASTDDMQGLLTLVWEHLLPAFEGPVDPAADDELAARLADLSLPTVAGSRTPTAPRAAVQETAGVRVTGLAETGEGWRLSLEHAGATYEVACGFGHWAPTSLQLDEHHLLEVCASGAWQGSGAFRAEVMLVRTPHRLRLDLDPETGACAAAWNTQPLGGFNLMGLALDARRR